MARCICHAPRILALGLTSIRAWRPIIDSVAAVVIEDTLPVRYETWAEWRLARWNDLRTRRAQPLVEPSTVFCGTCWGQRRTWRPAANGEGLIPCLCSTCLGRGWVRTGGA